METKLNNTNKSNPFKVPDNYFNEFENAIMEKVTREPKVAPKPKVIEMVRPYLYIAAGFLLILTVGSYFVRPFENRQDLTAQTIVVDEELDFMLSVTDDYSLVDFFVEEELEGSNGTLKTGSDEL